MIGATLNKHDALETAAEHPLRTAFGPESRKFTITVTVVAVYGSVYPAAAAATGSRTAAVAVIPVLVASWLLGWRSGVAVAATMFLLHLMTSYFVIGNGALEWLNSGGMLGTSALVLVALVTGALRDSRVRSLRELSSRRRAEQRLKEKVSELEKVEEALREANRELEERAWTIFDSAGVGVAIVDAHGRVLDSNVALRNTLGYTESELHEKTFAELTHPADRPEALRLFAAVVEGSRRGYQIEKRYLTKDGPVRWSAVTVAELRGNGDDFRCIAVAQDITEAKQAQFDATKARERLAGILDAADDAIISVDHLQCITMFNKGAERMFQYAAYEVVRSRIDILIPERLKESHNQFLARFAEGSEESPRTDRIELLGRRKDGTQFPVETSVSRLVLDGEVVLTIILRDVTERKRAENEIRSLARFPQEDPSPVMRIDKLGTILYANASSEPLVKLFGGGIGGEVPLSYHRWIEECLQANRVEERVLESGERTYSCVLWPAESRDYVNLYARDVTEARESHAALQAANARLETAITQLREAQAQIVQQERLRALGTMASGIAHDFNNALAPILGYSDLLLKRPHLLGDEDKVAKFLREINTAAKDGTEVVGRMREFYRHRDDFEEMETVDLNKIVEESVGVTQPRWKDMAQSRGVALTVETELSSRPSFVVGSDAGLRTALTNLILNGIDAMPGGGTLTISTRATDTLVELKVDDTGTGMTDDVRARSMEPFFTTKADGGSGLGLAMVHGIVERHGGQVAVDTELGRGTSFIIRLPTAKAPDDSSPDEEQSEPVEGCRVLVVDDEDHVRGLVSEYLSYDGNTVETAANGQQAIEKLRGDTFDIVITDRGMPLMNGDQLAETVKDVAPEVHVIMLTGVGEMMEDAGEHPEGVDLVVSKPVTEEDLRKAMRQTLGLEASPSTNGTDGPIQHAA